MSIPRIEAEDRGIYMVVTLTEDHTGLAKEAGGILVLDPWGITA